MGVMDEVRREDARDEAAARMRARRGGGRAEAC
jgi:hypothetical protein